MTNRSSTLFEDRNDAGQRLAEALTSYSSLDVLVLAIVRGGVPVAIEVAYRLGADLDIIIPRKIPIPTEPEAGYGAVTEDGTVVLNDRLVRQIGLSRSQIDRQAEEVKKEIARRSSAYRAVIPMAEVAGRRVIIVDDGLASGYTMIAAVNSVRNGQATQVAVAVPTCSESAYELVKPKVDDLVTLNIGRGPFFAVASYYRHWHDLTDEEVVEQLQSWKSGRP
ncbi:MAG: phosphoribosyltransferase family protein [Dehalococcoidia bacterium]